MWYDNKILLTLIYWRTLKKQHSDSNSLVPRKRMQNYYLEFILNSAHLLVTNEKLVQFKCF